MRPPAVVVLAAGRGSRLTEAGAALPKWLLPVDGTPIAHMHLAALRADPSVWTRLVVVTGHRSDAFDERELSALAGRECELVFNADYAAVNNWLSLGLALDHLAASGWEGPVCVLNSDLVVPPEPIHAVLRAAAAGSGTLLATDTRGPLSDEAMKVAIAADGRSVVDIGKGRLRGPPGGEYIGLSILAGDDVRTLRAILAGFADDPARHDEWYEAAYREAMDAGVPFFAFDIGDADWVEIDDERDLARAIEIAGRSR